MNSTIHTNSFTALFFFIQFAFKTPSFLRMDFQNVEESNYSKVQKAIMLIFQYSFKIIKVILCTHY